MEQTIRNRYTQEDVLPDLKGYITDNKFRKEVDKFFKYWDRVVINKAKNKKIYVPSMENLYGEICQRFENFNASQKQECLNSEKPFSFIFYNTNMKPFKVFPNKQDNNDFAEIFLQHEF